VGGEVAFDESYNGNCLVNAFTVGVLPKDRIFRGRAEGVGNPVIYVGAKTGRDGIHGATMASAQFDEKTEEKRPTVQVGDPFTEKLLLEACLELFETDTLVGIQDMGAAGLTSSSIEMASRAGSGLDLHVDRVPRREEGMTPYEVMLSESQERMLLVAARGREKEVLAIFAKWDLDAAVVGQVTDTGRVRLLEHGAVVADLPVAPLTDGAPSYDRPRARPRDLDAVWGFDPSTLPVPEDLSRSLLALLARPTIASKEWVYRQYDHMVRLGTVVRPGSDAAVVRLGDGTKGLALSVDCNSRFCALDPYEGARLAVAECARNVSCAGGEPLGLTDCLNFGNPEKPEVMWQLTEAIRGIGDACRALDVPVVSGNVSLYNDTDGESINPTPTVAIVGLVPDVARTVGAGFVGPGRTVAVLGRLTGELGGSEYLKAFFDKTAGRPPALDLALERAVQACVRGLVRGGLVESAHDCSEGGIAVALAECCVSGQVPVGAEVTFPSGLRAEALLFGEEPSRVVISFHPEQRAEVERRAAELGAPLAILGVTGGERLRVSGHIDAPVHGLHESWGNGLTAIFRGRAEARPPDRETGVP
jgi:phosphoribosylformylglycinamidine synthase